jgi:hypothetical protein
MIALHRLGGYLVPAGFDMSEEEKNIEILENRFPAKSGAAFADARQRVLASGQSVLQSEQGNIYEIFPDGRRVLVKTIEPPTTVVSGSRITIR